MNIRVDTLDYSRDLEKAGLERAHAEAIARLQARAINELVEHELVTKEFLRSELSQVRSEMQTEFGQIRSEMGQGKAELRSEFKTELAQLEGRLREEIRNESNKLSRQNDAMMLQLRALMLGGSIAAFAISAIVLMARLIR